MRKLMKARLRRAVFAALGCLLLCISPVALAQTNATGTVFGSAKQVGSKVVVTNVETGAVRHATIDTSGRFRVTALPPGVYKAELQTDGQTVSSRSGINVVVGSGSEISFDSAKLEDIVVTAKRGEWDIDVSATDTRTVFTAKVLEKISVGRSIEDIALLAPGVVRGDSRYSTDRGRPAASFGGSGANENAFYINGYAVTDPLRGLGSSSLPFDAIGQYQLLTGGYGAEFGRSTGGVANIVTKRGTNQWVAGGLVTWSPESLRAEGKDIYYPDNGTDLDGVLWAQGSKRQVDSLTYGAYVGGPVVRDKLFIYLNAEMENRSDDGPRSLRNTTATQANEGEDGWFDRDYDIPRWLAKVDWDIADGHALEFTAISDVQKQTSKGYGYYYTADNAANVDMLPLQTKGSQQKSGYDFEDGGELYIAKYTGSLTDSLILTALYGSQKNIHRQDPYQYDSSVVVVRDDRNIANGVNRGVYQTLKDSGAYDKTDGYRLDLEWLAGDHSVRVGYDVQDLEVRDGTVTAGPGYFWNYRNTGEGEENNPIQGGGGAVGPGGNGDFVEKIVYNNGGVFKAEQFAYFIEDRWQITDGILLTAGLRNENFKNYSADNKVFLDQTDQWAPRLGISWDVFGDSSLRAFANAGRYHLGIPLNLAFRQVGGSEYTREYFAFDGIDPSTGEPQGLRALGNGPFSVNQEYGQARDPQQAAARDLDPYFQDELALGFEAKLHTDWVGGARFIYRDLGSQIDDICDSRPAYNWALRNGYGSGTDADETGLDDGAEKFGAQLAHCMIINPGESNTVRLNAGSDADPDYRFVNLSAADIGLPEVKRTYQGLDLFIEHPFRDSWYGKVDWTISRSTGNAEGQLLSDVGQQDVSVTLNWDHGELMQGASGYLPNDRRHQIKAWGFYELNPQWRVSATLTAASGRPRSPTGIYGGDAVIDIEPSPAGTCDSNCYFDSYIDYGGPYYRYVDGKPSPRGSGGRLPWTTVLDLGASYAPDILKQQLRMAVDVFNVLDAQQPQNVVEFAESAPGTPYHSANKVISYNSPRSVRFTVRYDWGL